MGMQGVNAWYIVYGVACYSFMANVVIVVQILLTCECIHTKIVA